MSKIYFDQPILACIQQHTMHLCSPVGSYTFINLFSGHGKGKLDFNQTFMSAYLELETTGQRTDNILGILQKY